MPFLYKHDNWRQSKRDIRLIHSSCTTVVPVKSGFAGSGCTRLWDTSRHIACMVCHTSFISAMSQVHFLEPCFGLFRGDYKDRGPLWEQHVECFRGSCEISGCFHGLFTNVSFLAAHGHCITKRIRCSTIYFSCILYPISLEAFAEKSTIFIFFVFFFFSFFALNEGWYLKEMR